LKRYDGVVVSVPAYSEDLSSIPADYWTHFCACNARKRRK